MTISRRRFLSLAGSTAFAVKSGSALATSHEWSGVACIAAKGASSGLHLLSLRGPAPRGPEWRELAFVPAEEPVALVTHPDRRICYVLHDVGIHRALPRGYVSAYRVDNHRIGDRGAQLAYLGSQPLSLSATFPRHLAISPDGQSLVVSAHGGGIFNLLPIRADGSIGRVRSIRKETGCGPDAENQQSSHPQAVLFSTRGGCVVAADQGTDTVTVLDTNQSLRVIARCALPSGTGPRSLAIHHASGTLFISGCLSRSLFACRIESSSGRIAHPVSKLADGVCGALATHPVHPIVYAMTSGGLTAFSFQGRDSVIPVQHVALDDDASRAHQLQLFPPLNSLFLSTPKGVLCFPMDATTGAIEPSSVVAPVRGAQAIAFFM